MPFLSFYDNILSDLLVKALSSIKRFICFCALRLLIIFCSVAP